MTLVVKGQERIRQKKGWDVNHVIHTQVIDVDGNRRYMMGMVPISVYENQKQVHAYILKFKE